MSAPIIEEAKATLREAAQVRPSNPTTVEAIRRARRTAWLLILKCSPISESAALEYGIVVEQLYGEKPNGTPVR